MLKAGELHLWRVRLDNLDAGGFPAASPEEQARAARFHSESARGRYLNAHRALRCVLAGATGGRLDFSHAEKGKPYLASAPELRFNLSRSHGLALIVAALDVEVGVDVERLRHLPELLDIAERFFPPGEYAALADTAEPAREREFFRRWTRIEAMLKAQGVGLYGAGAELGGQWTVQEIDVGPGFAAAAAATREGMPVLVHDFEGF